MRARSSAPLRGCRALGLALALTALPCPGAPAAGEASSDAWHERIASAHREVANAQQRAETARSTYQDWRQRKYPRGVRKEELVRDVDEADEAVREAEARLVTVLEQARREGVPPGVLREFE